MSYSRWSNSIWYTFWSDNSPNHIFKKDQIFEICDLDGIYFTYEELKEDIDGCLQKVKLHYLLEKEIILNENFSVNKNGNLTFSEKKINKKPFSLKQEQLEELKNYMLEFIEDVENDESLI